MDAIQKIAMDLIEAYGLVVGLAIITFALRWVAAHAKTARLRNTAKYALNAVSAVETKNLSNDDKKKQAVELLNHTYGNNNIFGTITEQELDMHIEGALQKLRTMQVDGSEIKNGDVK